MHSLTIAARAALPVMLIVAGASKLSDPSSFAATLRLFVPRRAARLLRPVAYAIVVVELALGLGSLAFPAQRTLSLAILGVAGCFVGASTYGYAFHRGRSCSCFGALSGRRFDATAILRSAAILVVAVVALGAAPPGSVAIDRAERLLLVLAGLALALGAFGAARALVVSGADHGGWEAR